MILQKLKSWILPKEINFFNALVQQSLQTQYIIEALGNFYVGNTPKNQDALLGLIAGAKKSYSANLKELNATFITPIDKEAISREHNQLYWVTLSVKHLMVEIDTYQIYNLIEYSKLFDLLQQQMEQLTEGFKKLEAKQYEDVLKNIDQIIHLGNDLIKAYANALALLFKEQDMPHVLMHKEILSQLKEISKRIHICANLLEDIIFKIN
ncbi:DUF47 domain-containing protein [Mangrovimonas sp. DI 80]|uniref:DUF47 domain-containing protein n=1 Tax=Mangrovimonas sp. DI 80 TaxID=1779330 RepID=UPI000978B0B6|nr:hypothetical protein [Mangrovimonas sp. DI 80]OMP32846.1 hypothetical protein BKM32_00620 [Mangrovimonas sp. DI 80]